MPLQWDHLADAALDAAIVSSGLQVPQAADRAAKQNLLILAGITPAACLIPLLPPQAPANPPKIQLQRQLESEPALAFLDRARLVLDQPSLTDEAKSQYLLSAVQPDLAALIVAKKATENPTFPALLAYLREQVTVVPTTALAQFQSLKPAQGESFTQFGHILRSLYLQYLKIDLAAYHAQARFIAPAIIARILQVVPNSVRAQLQTKYDDNPQIALDDFLRYAESLSAPTAIKHQGGQTFQRAPANSKGDRAAQPNHFCAVHGQCFHTTQQCRVAQQQQRPMAPRLQPTPAGRQQRTAAVEPLPDGHLNATPVLGFSVEPTPDY
ncbi:MAG: hypothetical protein NHG36_16780 [Chromatiaceae bacterium]|nr:hypothetical protein [Candidatus Thioaporhodococcus sediminis]